MKLFKGVFLPGLILAFSPAVLFAAVPVVEPTNLLLPPNGVYGSTNQWDAAFNNGFVFKNTQWKFVDVSFSPPPTGTTYNLSFNLTADMQASTDGGVSFQFVRASGAATMSVTNTGAAYNTEMLALNIAWSGLTPGMLTRESPTQASRGVTEITPQADGSCRVSSFFDVFLEMSTDNGQTWFAPTNGSVRLVLTKPGPDTIETNLNFPPAAGKYSSGTGKSFAEYSGGIIISNAVYSQFDQSQTPPAYGGSQYYSFGSTLSGLISLNSGVSFNPFSAPASSTWRVTGLADSGSTRFFDAEIVSLNVSGGTLPGGILIRESPTKASLGRTSVRTNGVDCRASSFFDVFTEVSTDGGATWYPLISGPGTLTLATSNLPSPITLKNPAILGNRSFQFAFTNTPGIPFTVLASTNVTFPRTNWIDLGTPAETPAGQYQFNDPQATNSPQKFYQVRSP